MTKASTRVQWMNEVDMMTNHECLKAEKPQWIATVSGTIGPFDTQDEASEALKRIQQLLPVNIHTERGRR